MANIITRPINLRFTDEQLIAVSKAMKFVAMGETYDVNMIVSRACTMREQLDEYSALRRKGKIKVTRTVTNVIEML